MKPSGIITITTDFGHKGPFAAVMKGVILERFRQAEVIDLAHDIPAHWPPEAGFWISRSYRFFPSGTVHVAIVDPGVGSERDILMVEHDGHAFMAPDNGLLATLLDSARSPVVYRLRQDKLPSLGITEPSLTFHGRDIFAPVAANIASGRIPLSELGERIDTWTLAWIDEPEVTPERITGVVITVDAFGNLISNIDKSALHEFRTPIIHLGGHTFKLEAAYGRVRPGEYLGLINSFGVVEIARAEGSAADGLGVDRGAPVVITHAD
jgi:S-adenosylmethionine hydrolase